MACVNSFEILRDFFRNFGKGKVQGVGGGGSSGGGGGGGGGAGGNTSGNQNPSFTPEPYLDVVNNQYLNGSFPPLTPSPNLSSLYGVYYETTPPQKLTNRLFDALDPLLWKNKLWDASQLYALNEVLLMPESSINNKKVISLYRCKQALTVPVSTPPPQDPVHWEFLTRVGDSNVSAPLYRWKGDSLNVASSVSQGDLFTLPASYGKSVFVASANQAASPIQMPVDGSTNLLNDSFWHIQTIGLNLRGEYQAQATYFQGDVVYELQSPKRAWKCVTNNLQNVSPVNSVSSTTWQPLFPFTETNLHFEGDYSRSQSYTDKSLVLFHGELYLYSGSLESKPGIYPSDFTIMNASNSSSSSGLWTPFFTYLRANTSLTLDNISKYAPMQLAGFWNQGNVYKLNDMVLLPDTAESSGYSLYVYNAFSLSSRINPPSLVHPTNNNAGIWTKVLAETPLPYFGCRPAPTFPLYGPDFVATYGGSVDTNQVGFLDVIFSQSSDPARQFFSGKNVLNEVLAWSHFIQTTDGKKGIQSLVGNKYQIGMNTISLNILNGLMLLFGVDQTPSANRGFMSLTSIQVDNTSYPFDPQEDAIFMSNPLLTEDGLTAGCVVHDRRTAGSQSFMTLQYDFPSQWFAMPYLKADVVQKKTHRVSFPRFNPEVDTANQHTSLLKNLISAIQVLSPTVSSDAAQTTFSTTTLPELLFSGENKVRLQSFVMDGCWNVIEWSNATYFGSYDSLYAQLCESQDGFSDSILFYYGGNISREASLFIPIYDYQNINTHTFQVDGARFSASLTSPLNSNCVDALAFPNDTTSFTLAMNPEAVYPTRVLTPLTSGGRKPFCGDLLSALKVCSGFTSLSPDAFSSPQRRLLTSPYLRKNVLDRISDALENNKTRSLSTLDFCLFQMCFNIFSALAFGSVMKHTSWNSFQSRALYLSNANGFYQQSALTVGDVIRLMLQGRVGVYCTYKSESSNVVSILIQNGTVLNEPNSSEQIFFRLNVQLNVSTVLGQFDTLDTFPVVVSQTFASSVSRSALTNTNSTFTNIYI